MGRTLPSATQILIHEQAAFGPFRSALPRSDRFVLNKLFSYARLHLAAAQYASPALPFEVIVLAMLLEEHKQVMRLRKQIEPLLNNRKSDIPENESVPASQSTLAAAVDLGLAMDDNPNNGKGEEYMESEKNKEYLFNALELANLFEVSKSTIYKLMQSGEIPTVRMGRQVKVRVGDLRTFIREHLKSNGIEPDEETR